MAHQKYRREVSGSSNVVLFIHGILGSPDQFKPFYEAVPEDWSIVSLLLDGHGGSVKDFSHTSMYKWKAQVKAETDALASRYERIYIVGHSMGTFFAMDTARRLPNKVKAMFLLCTPLVIALTPRAGINSMKVIFTSPPDADPMTAAARAAYSIEPDKRLWRYIGWIPRYLELFREARFHRKAITTLSVPCRVYQSVKDELVGKRSKKYIAKNPDIVLCDLANSSHSCFDEADMDAMLSDFGDMCNKI